MCTGRDLIARVDRARLPYAENLVSGDLLGVCEDVCVLGPFLHEGCASAAWVHDGSLGNDMGAGSRCLTTQVGVVRWSGPPCSCAGT